MCRFQIWVLDAINCFKESNINHSEIALHSQAEEIYLETLVLCGRQQQTHAWLMEKQND